MNNTFQTSPHSEALVELRDIRFGYGERVILDGISLTIPRGKVTALMGASGGGKTTVMRLIGGQYRAQAGSLTFDGQEVAALNSTELYAVRRRMGMLFQFGALFTRWERVVSEHAAVMNVFWLVRSMKRVWSMCPARLPG